MLLDYTKFFNFHDPKNKELAIKSNYDFNSYFALVLNNVGCNPYYIRGICNTVFASMTTDKCYYHTPIHILSLIAFTEKNNIKLENWEKLTILFHDAIYKPGSKNNEINSIQFMLSLLDGTNIPENLKMQSAHAIQATAMHLEEELDPEFSKVLDLDMSGFSLESDSYEIQNKCIELEFTQTLKRYDGVSKEVYLAGRKNFLTELNSKKSIYRTEFFKTNFEAKARYNISESLKSL